MCVPVKLLYQRCACVCFVCTFVCENGLCVYVYVFLNACITGHLSVYECMTARMYMGEYFSLVFYLYIYYILLCKEDDFYVIGYGC